MYCIKCGKEMPDDAKFCGNCGEPVRLNSPRPNMGEENGKLNNQFVVQRASPNASISISRKPNLFAGAIAISIFVDGEYSGKVKNGGNEIIPVPQGIHKVYVSGNNYNMTSRSEVVILNLGPGMTENLSCGFKAIGGVFLKKP